jgi:hypothetical protein
VHVDLLIGGSLGATVRGTIAEPAEIPVASEIVAKKPSVARSLR